MNSGLKPCLKLDLALGIFMNEREWQQQQHLSSNNIRAATITTWTSFSSSSSYHSPWPFAFTTLCCGFCNLLSAKIQQIQADTRYKIRAEHIHTRMCEAGAPGQIINPVPGTVAGGFLVRFPWPNEARVTSPQFINKIH